MTPSKVAENVRTLPRRCIPRLACALAIALSLLGPTSSALAAERVTYHGGPLISHPRIYVDFWGPGWSSDPLNERAYLPSFLSSINNSSWLKTVGQYRIDWHDTLYEKSWSDPALSHRPGPNPSKSAVQAEVRRAAQHFGIINNRSALIVISLPAGGTCNAYHDWESEVNVAYAVNPYNTDSGCKGGADTVSHEIAEAMTDPQPSTHPGWTPEIADNPCQVAGHVTMPNGKVFYVQKLWSNNAGRCVLTS